MSDSLDFILGEREKDAAEKVLTWTPGRVVRDDRDLQQVDVQPLIKTRRYGEDDVPEDTSAAIVVNVPVKFVGDGDIDISWTITAGGDGIGTKGILLFCRDSLEDWKETGAEVGPYEYDKHDPSDAVFIPGLQDFGHPRMPTPENGIAMRIRSDAGPFKIEMDRTTQSMHFVAPNELIFEAGLRIQFRAPDVFVEDRRIDDNEGDIG